jgi:hypothetical protein
MRMHCVIKAAPALAAARAAIILLIPCMVLGKTTEMALQL